MIQTEKISRKDAERQREDGFLPRANGSYQVQSTEIEILFARTLVQLTVVNPLCPKPLRLLFAGIFPELIFIAPVS
jgi:hypothetical protein